jgi:hypothetical protein
MIGLIGAILPSVMEVAGRFLPEDPKKRAEAERKIEAQLTEHLAKIDLAQLDINKTEAAHRSIFIAGGVHSSVGPAALRWHGIISRSLFWFSRWHRQATLLICPLSICRR